MRQNRKYPGFCSKKKIKVRISVSQLFLIWACNRRILSESCEISASCSSAGCYCSKPDVCGCVIIWANPIFKMAETELLLFFEQMTTLLLSP